jgi:hypothetical protein
MLDQISQLTSTELADEALAEVSGGDTRVFVNRPVVSATIQFGNQELVVWATSQCHGLVWS